MYKVGEPGPDVGVALCEFCLWGLGLSARRADGCACAERGACVGDVVLDEAQLVLCALAEPLEREMESSIIPPC